MLKIMCFVVLSFLLAITNVVRCNSNYEFNKEAGGWLKLHRIPANFEEALLRCQYEGAVLASPLNKQLVDAIYSLFRKAQFNDSQQIHLGTHDLYGTRHFVSIEGVPLEYLAISWATGGASRSGHCLCASLGSDRCNMYIDPCEIERHYICYKKLDNQTMNECGTFDDEYQFKRCTGSCYKVHQEIRTWSQAFGICASEGGYLVILNNKEEARVVKELFPERSEQGAWDQFHVGVAAWSDDRIWNTIHGEKFDDVFNVWNVSQPNNVGGRQNRLSFVREGGLNDIEPNFKAMFVCEKSPQSRQFVMPED